MPMQLRKRHTVDDPENSCERKKTRTSVNIVGVKTNDIDLTVSHDEKIQPTIFDTLCLELLYELLNWLDIDSLCNFSQTCKSSQQMAKNYFNMKYPSLAIDVGDEDESKPLHLRCFGDVVQHLQLSGASIDDFKSSAAKANTGLRELSFNRTTTDKKEDHLTKGHIESITDILKDVKTVCAVSAIFERDTAEYLLAKCERIREFGFAVLKDTKYKFQFQKLPTLRNLEICFDSRVNARDSLNIINKKGVHFDELVLSFASEHNGYMNLILDDLESMHKKEKIKQLFLNFESRSMVINHIHRLESMPFLKGLICAYEIDKNIDNHLEELSKLNNIKYLSILAQQLDQLVEIKIDEVTIDAMLSFVRHSPNLMHFHNKHVRGNVKLNLITLNQERAKINSSKKLNIYIPEEKFMKLKWSLAPITGHWVEVRREESYIPRRHLDDQTVAS